MNQQMINEVFNSSEFRDFVDKIANVIQPQGEWIRDKGEYIDCQIYKVAFRCSLCCGKFNSSYNYCPNCGAKMKNG